MSFQITETWRIGDSMVTVDNKLFKFLYGKTDYKTEILYYWRKYLKKIINIIDITTCAAIMYKLPVHKCL